MVRLKL